MKFAILKAGTSTDRGRREKGDVEGMFKSLLAQPGDDWEVYEVKKGQFPARIEEFDGIVITGSPKSAYDDLPWIHQLGEAIRQAYKAEVPMLGVCFGHQMVAQALGGEVTPNPNGWDIGINHVNLTARGRSLPILNGAPQPIRILEVHQDIVSRLPTGAEILATSAMSDVEMFCLGSRVLCLQGHPEMDNEEVREIILSRNWLPKAAVERGLAALNEMPDRDYMQGFLVRYLQSGGLTPGQSESSAAG